MGAWIFSMQRAFDPGEDRVEAPHLEVSNITSRIVPSSEGQRMFVFGDVRNTSAHDAATIWFRVNIFDEANHVVDSFLAQNAGLIVPGNGSTTFRVFGPISISATDVKRTEVTVERTKGRGKWD
jgi:hypothetical protein